MTGKLAGDLDPDWSQDWKPNLHESSIGGGVGIERESQLMRALNEKVGWTVRFWHMNGMTGIGSLRQVLPAGDCVVLVIGAIGESVPTVGPSGEAFLAFPAHNSSQIYFEPPATERSKES